MGVPLLGFLAHVDGLCGEMLESGLETVQGSVFFLHAGAAKGKGRGKRVQISETPKKKKNLGGGKQPVQRERGDPGDQLPEHKSRTPRICDWDFSSRPRGGTLRGWSQHGPMSVGPDEMLASHWLRAEALPAASLRPPIPEQNVERCWSRCVHVVLTLVLAPQNPERKLTVPPASLNPPGRDFVPHREGESLDRC